MEISQADLEERLFKVMKTIGYGESYVQRYKMISTFYQKRLPFIIYVAGTECMGKSTLITQLGDRINISNIVQTSIVHKVMSGLQAIMQSNKALAQEDEIKMDYSLGEPSNKKEDDATIIRNYVRLCRHVRKGCNFDIQKCFVDGKPLIIEGSHLEPNLYVDFNQE